MSSKLDAGYSPDGQTCIRSSGDIAVGELPRTCRGFHILVPGVMVFIDGDGVTQTMSAGYWNAGQIYEYMAKEILAGTTATGRVVY